MLSEEKAQLEQKLTATKQEIEQLQVEKVCNSVNVSAEKITFLRRVVFSWNATVHNLLYCNQESYDGGLYNNKAIQAYS